MTLEEKLKAKNLKNIKGMVNVDLHNLIFISDALSICQEAVDEAKLKENKMWREWITARGLTPINLADIDERIKELNESKK